jgi:hypothetical protein
MTPRGYLTTRCGRVVSVDRLHQEDSHAPIHRVEADRFTSIEKVLVDDQLRLAAISTRLERLDALAAALVAEARLLHQLGLDDTPEARGRFEHPTRGLGTRFPGRIAHIAQ